MVLLLRYLYFSKDPEGVQFFPGGPTFSRGWVGGSNVNFYRNPYICDFPGGSGPPIPPLDPHLVIAAAAAGLKNYHAAS